MATMMSAQAAVQNKGARGRSPDDRAGDVQAVEGPILLEALSRDILEKMRKNTLRDTCRHRFTRPGANRC